MHCLPLVSRSNADLRRNQSAGKPQAGHNEININGLRRLYATEISRLQKAEWLEYYAKARSIAITLKNICSGWRGTGIFPMNVNWIIHLLADNNTASPTISPQNTDESAALLVTSSPPDRTVLHNANTIFKERFQTQPLQVLSGSMHGN